MNEDQDDEISDRDTMGGPITDQSEGASEGAMHDQQAHEARCSVALGSAAGFLELLAAVVEAERLVVAGLSKEMPCRKMHENRHRAFREALSMATAYFQPNTKVSEPGPVHSPSPSFPPTQEPRPGSL